MSDLKKDIAAICTQNESFLQPDISPLQGAMHKVGETIPRVILLGALVRQNLNL